MHGNKKTFSCEVKVEVAGDHTAKSTVTNLCAYNRELKVYCVQGKHRDSLVSTKLALECNIYLKMEF